MIGVALKLPDTKNTIVYNVIESEDQKNVFNK